MKKEMPTLQQVLDYAEGQIQFQTNRYQQQNKIYIPDEQRKDIAQEARIRVMSAYEKIDPDMGWPTFIQRHCWGAVADYIRRGKGFQEIKWIIDQKDGDHCSLRFREEGILDEDGEPSGLDDLISRFKSKEPEEEVEDKELNIQWELLSRMASIDPDLHMFVRHVLLGQELTKLTKYFGLTRERLGQRVDQFVKSLDAPENYDKKWTSQIIYALGLCSQFHMPEIDQGCGWQLDPVDFTKLEQRYDKTEHKQMDFFVI